jgi:hypothetical protein
MPSDLEQRALSKLIAEAVRSASDLADLRKVAAALPLPIRVQLNSAIEELDLLRHLLHERTLLRVVATADELSRKPAA